MRKIVFLSFLIALIFQGFTACSRVSQRGGQSDEDRLRYLYKKGAQAYQTQDFKASSRTFEKALVLAERLRGKRAELNVLQNLGVVYWNLGDYPKAIGYFERALKIMREIGVPTRVTESNIGDAYLAMGRLPEAERYFTDRIRLGRLALVKGEHQKAVKLFEASLQNNLKRRNANFLFADYVGLGLGKEGLGDLEGASEAFTKAVKMVDEQRGALNPAMRSRFYSAKVMSFPRTDPFEGLARVLFEQGRGEEAFRYTENLKARILSEIIASRHRGTSEYLPEKLQKEEERLLARIAGLHKEMEVLYRNKAMETYYERETELAKLKSDLESFISALRKGYPAYASIKYPLPIGADEVKLSPDEVLVEFEVTGPATYVFLVTHNRVKMWRVDITREDLRKRVLSYRGFFEGVTSHRDLGRYQPAVGAQLYATLLGKILPQVSKGSRLIIVPDEFLGILPFEALVMKMPRKEKMGAGDYGPFPLGVTYLGDEYLVSYAQSATSLTLLRALRKKKPQGKDVLMVGDPIFSRRDKRIALAKGEDTVTPETLRLMGAVAQWKQMGVAGTKALGDVAQKPEEVFEVFPRLQRTALLAEKVKKMFGRKATVLIGSSATEEGVRKMDMSRYRYITFATHGILDTTVPWIQEPALVLTQVGNPEGYDGFLTAGEVMEMKMSADVVALTACKTGVGEHVRGEGVMGMGRAFQFAGASKVLMSLWEVAEDSTTELTVKFLEGMKDGREPVVALNQAREDIRRRGYEHPFYWAAFILMD